MRVATLHNPKLFLPHPSKNHHPLSFYLYIPHSVLRESRERIPLFLLSPRISASLSSVTSEYLRYISFFYTVLLSPCFSFVCLLQYTDSRCSCSRASPATISNDRCLDYPRTHSSLRSRFSELLCRTKLEVNSQRGGPDRRSSTGDSKWKVLDDGR